MVRMSLLWMLLMMIPFCSDAKVVFKGVVKDTDGKKLSGIMVRLYDDDKIKGYTKSKDNGYFEVAADTISLLARLTFISTNYGQKELWTDNTIDTIYVTMSPEAYTLKEVVVKVPRTRVKGDTITYDVASYTNQGDRNIEDVIKKLPGIQVDENGTILYEGETINNFYIEGLNLMGSNYAVATRGISPQDISTISVYERHQPKKVLKNVAESKKAALNLKLKKSRMLKPVGYVKGGAGWGDAMLWTGDIYGMFVSPDNQTIVAAKGNNTGTAYLRPSAGGDLSSALFPQTPFGTPPVSENRYLYNNSAYFTANSLFRPKENLTFTVNTSYGLEHSSFNGESRTEYLASGSGNIVYKEIADNRLKNHIVNGGMKVERNIDSFYLSDNLAFRGTFTNNDYEILNADNVGQMLRQDSYTLYNGLSLIVRRGNNVFELQSDTQYDNTPYNRMSATDLLTGNTLLTQSSEGQRFYNMEQTSFSWLFGRGNTAGTRLSFRFVHDEFESTLEMSESGRNDMAGNDILAVAEPYYKFSRQGKFSVEAAVPVGFNFRRITDYLNSQKERLDEVYPDFKLTLFYKINQFQHIDASAGWTHDYGSFRDYVTGEIYTTFRNMTVLGTGLPGKTLNKFVRASYFYRNPVEGIYGSASVNGSIKDNDRMGVSDVDVSGTSSGYILAKNKTKSLNATLTASKDVYTWNTSFSLNANALFMKRDTRRGELTINVDNRVYIITGKVETHQFGDVLGAVLNVSYTLNRVTYGGLMPATSLDELTANCKVSVFPVKGVEIYGRAYLNRSQTDENHHKSNLFVDAGARWSLRKWELELTARNLTNLKDYSYTTYRTLDITRYRYSLRPLELLLTLRYNF